MNATNQKIELCILKLLMRMTFFYEIGKAMDGIFGTSFFENVNTSFAKIREVIGNIFDPKDAEKYQLPTILVVGGVSSGKSSLLENIIKCEIFPKDSKTCTLAPIHIVLKNCSKKEKTIAMLQLRVKSILWTSLTLQTSSGNTLMV
jgi:hypothetical protein